MPFNVLLYSDVSKANKHPNRYSLKQIWINITNRLQPSHAQQAVCGK